MSRRHDPWENQNMYRSRGGRCFDCLSNLCCTIFTCWGILLCSLLGILLIMLAILAVILIFFNPQIPSYSIDSLDLMNFEFRTDGKVYSEIALVVKADNPNKGIAIGYGDNNFTLVYSGSDISSGNFTPFLQPDKNTTMISIMMKGASEFGPKMVQEYIEQDKAGRIPLLVRFKVPVSLLIFDIHRLKKFIMNGNCTLEVDHLQPNKKPSILKREFTYSIAV